MEKCDLREIQDGKRMYKETLEWGAAVILSHGFWPIVTQADVVDLLISMCYEVAYTS